jgi:hypothetical protein
MEKSAGNPELSRKNKKKHGLSRKKHGTSGGKF